MQGIKITNFVLAFVLAMVTMSVLVAPHVGFDPGTGPYDEGDVQTVGSELGEPEADAVGDQDPGFLGISLGVTSTLQVLWTVTVDLDKLLMSYGVPAVIALGVQGLVAITVGYAILSIFRGIKILT